MAKPKNTNSGDEVRRLSSDEQLWKALEHYEREPPPKPHSDEAEVKIQNALQKVRDSVEHTERILALGHLFQVIAEAKGFTPEEFTEELRPLRWGGEEDW